MATTEFIAAIELGSSKITGVAGRKNSDGSMQVLAYAQEDSSTFIRKGVIFNLDKTAQSLTSIINRLEGELKNSIAKVYVGIGGQSLRTVRNVVSRDLEEEAIISEELVSAIGDENIAIPVVDMDILDVAPQEYKVGNNLQANPVGLVGSHIEGRFLNIVARASVRKNLEHCFQQAKIDIADQLIAPLVTANAVLTESERRSGCALIDFGADTTTISVYKNNILRFLTVLPLGGNSITRDITTLQMEEEEAERLKKAYGDALYEEDPEQEEEATCKLEDDNRIIKVADLNNIIEARAEEIVANVWNQIQLSGYEDKLLAGLILTGGAANLKNLDETLRKRSKIEKIRMAKLPRNTVHAPNNILKKDGSQNTLFGLLFEGNQNCCLTETAPQAAPAPSVSKPEPEVHKTVDMFEDDQELKEQARIARLKKEEEEREAKLAAKEAEKLRKQKEKEEKRKELGIPQDAFLITNAAEFTPNKNQKTVIEAIEQLHNPNIYFVMCGIGEKKAELEQYVKEHGLEEHIRFVGFRNDLHEILQTSDCFVLSSFREGLSVALMEAMAEGLPVVCGRIRGNVDLIKDGKGGILVSPENKEDYEAAFRKLYEMKHKELAAFQRLGKINAENVKSFGRSAVERLMENVYIAE